MLALYGALLAKAHAFLPISFFIYPAFAHIA
jgi:hypothetical protein